jgi:hypothetical protein
MKLNMNDFKKVKEDKSIITMMHPKGHQITIAKESLSPGMKSDFAAMPLHQAQSDDMIQDPNQEKDPGILDKIESGIKSFMAPEQSPQERSSSVSPDLQAKRNIYNQEINQPIPATGLLPSLINAGSQLMHRGQSFIGDQPPEKINGPVWDAASKEYEQQKAAESAKKDMADKQKQNDIMLENKARIDNGLAPIQIQGPQQASLEPQTGPPGSQVQNMQGVPPDISKTQTQPRSGGPIDFNDPLGAYRAGAQEQYKGIQNESNVVGQEGTLLAQNADAQARASQNLQNRFDQEKADWEKDRQALTEAYNNGKIQPNHYLENMSTAGKIATAFGMLFSGAGSGLSGQSNMAQDFLNKQIERDLGAQKENLGVTKNLLDMNMRHFGNILDATNATRVMISDLYGAQANQIINSMKDPMAQAKARQQLGQLQAQKATEYYPMEYDMNMRQAAQKAMKSGEGDPSVYLPYMARDPKEREDMTKELGEAKSDVAKHDQAMNAFDVVNQASKPGYKFNHPRAMLSGAEDAALNNVLIEGARDETGRINDTVLKSLQNQIMPRAIDRPEDTALRKQALSNIFTRKQYPTLARHGYNPYSQSMYNQQGQMMAKEGPVK